MSPSIRFYSGESLTSFELRGNVDTLCCIQFSYYLKIRHESLFKEGNDPVTMIFSFTLEYIVWKVISVFNKYRLLPKSTQLIVYTDGLDIIAWSTFRMRDLYLESAAGEILGWVKSHQVIFVCFVKTFISINNKGQSMTSFSFPIRRRTCPSWQKNKEGANLPPEEYTGRGAIVQSKSQ